MPCMVYLEIEPREIQEKEVKIRIKIFWGILVALGWDSETLKIILFVKIFEAGSEHRVEGQGVVESLQSSLKIIW